MKEKKEIRNGRENKREQKQKKKERNLQLVKNSITPLWYFIIQWLKINIPVVLLQL